MHAFNVWDAPADCMRAKRLVERFASAFGLEVKKYHDFTPVDFCDDYMLQLRLPNGEALAAYPGKNGWCIPEIVCGRSEVRLFPAYIELLSRIIGARLVLWGDDNGRRILDGIVFAESVDELEVKLAAMGY